MIFDECTSGFRETFGGIHKKFGVEPDMAMYGKTLGNGYAITAVVGRKSVMESAQNTFISSTFWTERIGPSAALATLSVMEDIKSWKIITEIGKKMRLGWKSLANKHNLKIKISGLPSLSSFIFESDNHLKYKTFLSQEMLKKGFLASTIFYSSIAHEQDFISKYLHELDNIFYKISLCEKDKININELLEGPICHNGFSRLN